MATTHAIKNNTATVPDTKAHKKLDAKIDTGEKTISDKRMKFVDAIGRIAAIFSIVMYVAYITQISNNLTGHPGSPWQPLAATFNCVFWAAYGFLKPKKDWPIIAANVPGIFLAFAAFITALIH